MTLQKLASLHWRARELARYHRQHRNRDQAIKWNDVSALVMQLIEQHGRAAS